MRAFAYPNGDWNDRVSKQVEQTGYRCAFTTHPGLARFPRKSVHHLSRVLLHEGNITSQDWQILTGDAESGTGWLGLKGADVRLRY